jgi:putative ABC transport system substrate-binding protein
MKYSFLSLSLGILILGLAHAQAQPKKMPLIGYISGTGSESNRGPFFAALRQRLQEIGYNEGKNIAFEYRGAEGKVESLQRLVKELVDLKVDVLVVPLASGVRDAKQSTKTIPIVMVTQVDPVAAGLVESLAHPGGNITGLSSLQRDLSGKRLELLKEVVPGLSRVAILRDSDPESLVSVLGAKDYEETARALKIQPQSLDVRGPNPDLERAFRDAVKKRAGALITITNNTLFRNSTCWRGWIG